MAVLAPDVACGESFPALIGELVANHLGCGALQGEEADAERQQAGQHGVGGEAAVVEAVRLSQDPSQVQAALRTIKAVLELRPAWHRTEERVQAHLLVASLEPAIDRALERKLRTAAMQLNTRAAWVAMEQVNPVEVEMRRKALKRGVCVNTKETRNVLRAPGIKPRAPHPPAGGRADGPLWEGWQDAGKWALGQNPEFRHFVLSNLPSPRHGLVLPSIPSIPAIER